jgi:hypothetical protein
LGLRVRRSNEATKPSYRRSTSVCGTPGGGATCSAVQSAVACGVGAGAGQLHVMGPPQVAGSARGAGGLLTKLECWVVAEDRGLV